MAIHPTGCHCDGCQGYDTPTGSPDKPAAALAQSAPSAEPPIDSAEEWLRIQSLNGRKLLLTSQQQPSDSPYMNVQQAMEAYAALRTAQLERELQDSDRMNHNLLKMKMLEETRAETAEKEVKKLQEELAKGCWHCDSFPL